jgi:hypothetical protein
MDLRLDKYTSNGTLYDVLDEVGNPTGQKCYKSSIGEENVSDGATGFLPFLLQGSNINFGKDNHSLEFAADKQVIKRAGETICSSFKFIVQAYVGGQWVDQPHNMPDRSFKQGQVFREGGWMQDDKKCTGYLTFPDAHLSFGQQKPYDLQIGLEAGGSSRSSLGFRFRAPASGQIRFLIVLDGLQKLPTDWEWIEGRNGIGSKEIIRLGIQTKDFKWMWTKEEAPYRDITVENNPDNTKKILIIFGTYNYIANNWLTVYPDTWGATETSNDCAEEANASYFNDLTYYGTPGVLALGIAAAKDISNLWHVGFIFSNVTASGTISSAILTLHGVSWYVGNTVYSDISVCDVDSPAAWSSSNRPSQQANHADPIAFDLTGQTGTVNTNSFAAALQHRFDDVNWASGNSVAIVIITDYAATAANETISLYATENASQATTLTIVFTPPGGSGLAIPVLTRQYRQRLQ